MSHRFAVPIALCLLTLAGPVAPSLPAAEPSPSALAHQRARAVLAYLKSIRGKAIVAGIHNREPNQEPSRQTDRITALTGRHPALWSGDFLFSAADVSNRWTLIRECRRQWEQGSIVQLLAHVAPPNQPEVCRWRGGIQSRLSDDQWRDLVTDGGTLNRAWKERLDGYAVYLRYLQTNGVPVLFRPLHEMNQGRFWWGGRPGPDGTARLYRLTHDHLTRTRGLTNLLWVWDMQDLSRDFADYNPGADYWDIFAFDIYNEGFQREWYDLIRPLVGDKPMGIGECERLPSLRLLAEQPDWCFFMSWAELTFSRNPPERITALYHATNVVTRERLPRFP